MKKIINTKERLEFMQIIEDLLKNPTVRKMQEYRQHYDSSCFEHCLEVSYISYLICKKLKLDYISAARAGMLHDLFLYDWRHSHASLNGWHAFEHPKIALNNSLKLFELNSREQDIIVKHMWPVTLSLPKYKESYIITLVDKYSALKSCSTYFLSAIRKNNVYKTAYIFLTFLIFNTHK